VEYTDGERELYDLRTDPDELNNLAANASPALLKQLSARLAVMAACHGGSCQPAENGPVPRLGT
jgi:hypothetical protein